ncbi:MAG: hypothetical protein CVU43_22665 [Chloroflexi bacterium HGW-Chloroflexi-5]|jgi:uncharacterized lipoprotein YbaY|nr:MAG: hypothetical protein CVU43_22665 [Chloroflexi bacterium HGW-Chloroflexi-5]
MKISILMAGGRQRFVRLAAVLLGISLFIVLSSCNQKVGENVVPSDITATHQTKGVTPTPSGSVVSLGFNVTGWT